MGTEGNGTCKREEIDALDSCVLFISLRAYRCVFILHDRIQSDKKMLEIATSADDGGAKEGGKEGNTEDGQPATLADLPPPKVTICIVADTLKKIFITPTRARTHAHTHRRKGTQTDRNRQTETDRQIDRQTDRQKYRQTDRQTDRQTHRQTHTDTHTYTHNHTHVPTCLRVQGLSRACSERGVWT